MNLARQAGFDSAKALSSLGLDMHPLAVLLLRDSEDVAFSGFGWTMQQYSGFLVACGFAAFVLSGLACAVLCVAFGLGAWIALVALPMFLLGALAGRMHVAAVAARRERQLEAELLAALSQFRCGLRAGKTLLEALSDAAAGGHGEASGILCHAIALVSEGESVEQAFREAALLTRSEEFRAFAASVSRAHASGLDLTRVVSGSADAIAASRKAGFGRFSAESGRLSTIAVVATGIFPGMLVFAFVQSGFIFGLKIPIELFAAAFVFAFPLCKFFLQARLSGSVPGALK
jgi:Flp pilus assembly protein TadB